jgi:hypothetical protein
VTLAVSFAAADPVAEAAHRAALASLAGSFRVAPAAAGEPGVAVVSGARDGWPEAIAAAVRAGARGVLLARPRPAGADVLGELAALAADAGVPVAVDSPARLDPAWEDALPGLRACLGRATLLDSVAVLDPAHAGPAPGGESGLLAEGLLAQIALVRSLTGPLDALAGSRAGLAYHAGARAGPAAVGLAGTIGAAGAPGLRLDLVAPDEHWQVVFDAAAPAAATRIARSVPGGGELRPTRYESGRRVLWRALAAAIAGGRAVPYGPAELAEDAEVARAVLGRPS